VLLTLTHAGAAPSGLELADKLGSSDRREVEAAVSAIEHAPAGTPDLAEALFAAARTSEATLVDPARALALYDRIARELPDAREAIPAQRRVEALRAQLGEHGEYAVQAAELARLVAGANELAGDEIVRRGDALANAAWPGAPDATVWLAEWLRRAGRFAEAQARYTSVTARWPGTRAAIIATRGGAGCALDAHDWDRAEQLAMELPASEPRDQTLRADLIAAAARGRRFDRLYVLAWLAVGLAIAGLAGSLAEATLRGGRRRSKLRPPVEVMFLAPVAAVLIGVAFTAHRLIAPAVATLSLGGLAFAWLSGAALDALRMRGRDIRVRAVLHVIACIVGVAALGFIVLRRDSLIDIVIETVRFGPEP
jgi:hypothetical protein